MTFRPVFLTRASNAFSSLAVTVALAVLTILALAIGSMRDSKAETNAGLLLTSRIEDPSLEWGVGATVQGLPSRTADVEKPQTISRRPLSSSSSKAARSRVAGPSQEWMGVSKLAFPLLVSDLVVGQPTSSLTVMTGKSVGVK